MILPTMTSRTLFVRVFPVLLIAAAVAVPAAQAADPTGAQYQTSVNQVEKSVGGSDNGGSQSAGPLNSPVVSGLPFTGLDVVALGAVAVALMSLGLVLRRVTVPRPID